MSSSDSEESGRVGQSTEDNRKGKAVVESSKAQSGDNSDSTRPGKRKRIYRHTQQHTQALEAFFKECNMPTTEQRKNLSNQLGLQPLQVKFWFQNRRQQRKAQEEKNEASKLKIENEKLLAELNKYRETLNNINCPNCGGPSTLAEISFAGNYGNQPGMVGEMYGGCLTEVDRPKIMELATSAMGELIQLVQVGQPVWIARSDGTDVLNRDEYQKAFPGGINPRSLGLKTEGTRRSASIAMNHVYLVEVMMNVDRWLITFGDIVSKATAIEISSTGIAENHDGALQMITAEFQVSSPLIPTREIQFVRYCKQLAEGIWIVVDISLDSFKTGPFSKCRRKPSGCLIHNITDGFSLITWIEHVEVDDQNLHNLCKPLVDSGFAFGAERWIEILNRKCERLAASTTSNTPSIGVGIIMNTEGKKSVLKMAERMVSDFHSSVGTSTAHTWTILSAAGSDSVRVKTRRSTSDSNSPPGFILSAATSFLMPFPPQKIFDYLCDRSHRGEWDILTAEGIAQEMIHIPTGRNPKNCVSFLRINRAIQDDMLILQENYTDSTGSYVIYAPTNVDAVSGILNGGNPDHVTLLSSGYAILPDGFGSGNSLLTVALQMFGTLDPTARLSLGSVTTINELLKYTSEKVRVGVSCYGE